ncbi:MAG: diacylglycerol kinase family lipid kinase [Chloroflexi bacterium]|nr:diacylglycerol kinase family lipid kinase [Chloroflexota bacterium]
MGAVSDHSEKHSNCKIVRICLESLQPDGQEAAIKTARLILNPVAGRGRAGTLVDDIRGELRACGIETDLARTRSVRDAVDLAERAHRDGFDLVIAAGGDGTIHEVANGLIRASSDGVTGTLGIVPIGTGNDFIKSIGVPNDWQAACHIIGDGATRRVDVGRLNDDYFVNLAGIGFDAQVSIEAAKIRWARGMAVYVLALARNLLLSYRTPNVTLEMDGRRTQQRITMVAIGNGRCAGGGFWLTPHAEMDDGLLDICVADQLSRPGIMALIPHVMRGTHVGHKAITMYHARRIVVTSDEPLPIQSDGEIIDTAAHRLEAELVPNKLEVCAPRNRN